MVSHRVEGRPRCASATVESLSWVNKDSRRLPGLEVSFVGEPRTHALGHFRSSERSENRAADDWFQSTAAIARRPVERGHSPKRSPTSILSRSTADERGTSAVWSAELAPPTYCSRRRFSHRATGLPGGFNWSMQHTDCCVSRRSVADEVPDANFLHRQPEGIDVGALEARLDAASDCPAVQSSA